MNREVLGYALWDPRIDSWFVSWAFLCSCHCSWRFDQAGGANQRLEYMGRLLSCAARGVGKAFWVGKESSVPSLAGNLFIGLGW